MEADLYRVEWRETSRPLPELVEVPWAHTTTTETAIAWLSEHYGWDATKATQVRAYGTTRTVMLALRDAHMAAQRFPLTFAAPTLANDYNTLLADLLNGDQILDPWEVDDVAANEAEDERLTLEQRREVLRDFDDRDKTSDNECLGDMASSKWSENHED